jgi:hypothetical protein
MNILLYIHHLEFCADLRMGCGDLTVALMYQAMLTAFDDKDTTFGNGINIAGSNYEVHRFYDEDGMLLFRLCGIFGNHIFGNQQGTTACFCFSRLIIDCGVEIHPAVRIFFCGVLHAWTHAA